MLWTLENDWGYAGKLFEELHQGSGHHDCVCDHAAADARLLSICTRQHKGGHPGLAARTVEPTVHTENRSLEVAAAGAHNALMA
jgi:hypothetical protein